VLVGRGGGNKALLTAYFRPKIIIKSVHVCQSYSKLCEWTFWRHSVQCIPQRGRHETHGGNSVNWWVSRVVLVKRNWPVGRLSSKLKFAWRCLQELQPHIIRVATLPWKMWVAYESDIVINNVSKGSVATHLRCRSSIVTLLSIYCWMQNLSVNEFLKSVKNWHSYSHEYCVFLFRNMVYMSTWCRRRRGVSKTVFESWWNKTNVCFLFFFGCVPHDTWWSVAVSTIGLRRQSVRSLAFLQAEWIPMLTDCTSVSLSPSHLDDGMWASSKSTQRGFSKTVCSRNEWGLMWVDRCGLKRLWRLPALHGPTILIVECTQRYFWQL